MCTTHKTTLLMAGICFFFEDNDVDVWSGRRIDLDAWNYACKLSDIDRAVIINRTEEALVPFDADMDIRIVGQFDPELMTSRWAQLICPWQADTKSVALWDFDHDVDWYAFGPASGWWLEEFGQQKVYIPQNSMAACHSVHVATAVMYHRYKVKTWQ